VSVVKNLTGLVAECVSC